MPMNQSQINTIKAEISTCEAFMIPLVRESEQLDAISKERTLTLSERLRVQELIDLIHAKNVWLAKAKETVRKFYRPSAA